jgi:hypothetical protein
LRTRARWKPALRPDERPRGSLTNTVRAAWRGICHPRGRPAHPGPPASGVSLTPGVAAPGYAPGRMDLRRLHAGEWIAAASGLALLVSLFLPWYDARDDSISGWEALAVTDIVLAIVAACGVLLAIVTATQRVPAVPIALSALVTLVGAVGLVLIVVRALVLPDNVDGREWALWLGVAGAVGIVAGAFVSMRDERLSRPGRRTDATGRPVTTAPEVERMPAPRP